MGDKTKIEWTDASWTPIRARNLQTGAVGWFCIHKSDGCAGCYAEAMNLRLGTGLPFKPGHLKDIEIFVDDKILTQPIHWRRPRRIFPLSMTDLFGDFMQTDAIDQVFAVMAICRRHTFQPLTKRPDRMWDYFRDPETSKRILRHGMRITADHHLPMPIADLPLPNVWLGTSVEDQETADLRIPYLLATPAALRFLSCEPLLGPVNLRGWQYAGWDGDRRGPHVAWVIAGGESGRKARPMHPAWARSLRDQCAEAGTPFHFKQWGEWAPHKPQAGGDLGGDVRRGTVTTIHPSAETDVEVFQRTGRNTVPGTVYVKRVGKKVAGRALDGVEHNYFPGVHS